MGHTIQSAFGRIDYFDNHGFDCIAQYNDEFGIMFGNHTKERINKTPDSSNIVAVFRITKRKKRIVMYIIYNEETLMIDSTHQWMGKEILKILSGDKRLKYLNVTHPKTKAILSKINIANCTNYS